MKWKILAILASLSVFAAALSAAPKKAPKPAAPKVDAKAAAAAKAEADAKAKAEADAKAKEAAPSGPPEKASWANFGGNLVQGYTFNPRHPVDGYNGTVTWPDRANEYQLTQAWTYFEVPTDTSKKDFDFGGRVDVMFGSSYRWATSAGFEDKIFKTNTGTQSGAGDYKAIASSMYGLAIPAMYLDAAYKSFKLRVGHIVSPVGYNTIDTTQNPTPFIPYTYQYGEPFTHFGAWLYWEVNKKLTVMGGPTRGGDNWDGAGTGAKVPGFLGTVTYIWDDKSQIDWVVHVSKEYNYKSQANSTVIDTTKDSVDASGGSFPYKGGYNSNDALYSWRYFQTLVYKRELIKDLMWVFQTDFGIQKVADIKAATDDTSINGKNKEVTAMWYGVNTYFIHQTFNTLQFVLNLEWFRDTAGVRVGGVLPTYSHQSSGVQGLATVNATPFRGNYIGNFFVVGFGPKWQPQKNFFVRVMGRYDYFDGTSINHDSAKEAAGTSGGAALPFFDGNRRDQVVVALDAAFLF